MTTKQTPHPSGLAPVGYDTLTEGQKTMGLALAGIGLSSVDYVRDLVVLDPLAAEMFGLLPGVPVTRAELHAQIHPADWPEVRAEVDKLLDPAFEDAIEVTHRTVDAEGRVRWVHSRKRLYRDEASPDRAAQTGVAAIMDITAEREAREANEFLIRELTHRTKNFATVIAAMATMVSRTGEPETFLDRFLPRLSNLAQNQDLLSMQETSSTLHETIDRALAPFPLEGVERLSVEGPALTMSGKASQTFAMLIHELATNAVKHGAWSRFRGRVTIEWTQGTDGGLVFTWREAGGPPVAEPTSEGFGSQVLKRFSALNLGAVGELDYAAQGVRYELRVPPGGLDRPG